MSESAGAVIVAAGAGTRMAGADKLFSEAAGRPLLAHAIAPFQQSSSIDRIILVMAPMNLKRGRELVERYGFTKVAMLVRGGERRQDSVRLGLEALGECDYVAVHDGARPLVTSELIERGREAGPDRVVVRTVERSRLWAVQTPQVFRYELLVRAHREVTEDVTDDAAMVEALGGQVRLFEGDRRNVKVTTVEDLESVRALVIARIEVA